MKVNSDNLKTLNNEEIKYAFDSSSKKIFKRYDYALLTKDEEDQLSIDAINIFKLIDFNEEDNLEKRFVKILSETIKEYIAKKLKNDNYAMYLIKYYIEKNISMPTNLREARNSISKVVKFISQIGYSDSFDIYETLIKDNRVIKSSLDYLYSGYKYLIENERINQLLSEKEMALLDAYLVCENIEFEDIESFSLSFMNDSTGTIDSLKIYLKDIGQIPIPTKVEEEHLGEIILAGNKANEQLAQIKAGLIEYDEELVNNLKKTIKKGQNAENKLVEANLRLAIAISKKYMNKGVDLLDLIQEGNKGLMKAAHLYDVSKGYRFTTYAIWWIKSFVGRYIGDNRQNIRIPVHKIEKLKKVHFAYADLFIELQREPSRDEVAERLGMTTSSLNALLNADISEVSLYTKVNDDDSTELEDFIINEFNVTEEENMQKNLGESVQKLLKNTNLSEKEYLVIVKRYGLDGKPPKTLEGIAQEFGVTRERIRQIEEKALRKFRRNGQTNGLSVFLDNPDDGLETLNAFRKTGIMPKSVKSYTSSNHFYETHQAKRAKSLKELLSKWDFELVQMTCDDVLCETDWEVIEKRYGSKDLTERGRNRLNEEDKLTHQKMLSHLKRELTKRSYYIENMYGDVHNLFPKVDFYIIDSCINKLSLDEKKLLESRFNFEEKTTSEKQELFHLLDRLAVSIKGKRVFEAKRVKMELMDIKSRLKDILTTDEAIFVMSGLNIDNALIICLYEGFNSINKKFTKEEICQILEISNDEIDDKIVAALKDFAEKLKQAKDSSLAKRYIK